MAKHCAECGTPVGSPVSAPLSPRCETCQITYQAVKPAGLFTRSQIRFAAAALGRAGRYVASESEVFHTGENGESDYNEPERVRILTVLIKQLLSDGWEDLPDKVKHPVFGYLWYGYRFHRLIRS
jgi:hypothetical protein